jgi:plasmid stabilization system protein ParE
VSSSVVFSPEALDQLLALYRYVKAAASPAIADRFTGGIVDFCERLRDFPHRSVRRDDVRPRLHITNYDRRVVIAYAIRADSLAITGMFYGGRDYENLMQPDVND